MIAPMPGMTAPAVMRDGKRMSIAALSQVLSFDRPDGQTWYVSVARMEELHAAHPHLWETIDVVIEGAEAISVSRNVEVDHARSLSAVRLDEPGFGVFLPDGAFLIIDGSHRFVRRSWDGHETMRFHVCWSPTWHPAMIDLPATLALWDAGGT